MDAVYTLGVNELTENFIENLKKTHQNKDVQIIISEPMDETEYLLSNKNNAEFLRNSIKKEKDGSPCKTLTIEEMEAMVK
jgi:hypothetical protein